MYGSQASSASVSRLRTHDGKLLVGEPRRIRSHALRIVEQQLAPASLCGSAKMSGMSSLSTGPVFTPTGPTNTSRRTRSGDFGRDSAAIQPPIEQPITSTWSRPSAVEQFEIDVGDVVHRIDPVGQRWICRSRDATARSADGRAESRRDIRMLGHETAGAVQEQDRRASPASNSSSSTPATAMMSRRKGHPPNYCGEASPSCRGGHAGLCLPAEGRRG